MTFDLSPETRRSRSRKLPGMPVVLDLSMFQVRAGRFVDQSVSVPMSTRVKPK